MPTWHRSKPFFGGESERREPGTLLLLHKGVGFADGRRVRVVLWLTKDSIGRFGSVDSSEGGGVRCSAGWWRDLKGLLVACFPSVVF